MYKLHKWIPPFFVLYTNKPLGNFLWIFKFHGIYCTSHMWGLRVCHLVRVVFSNNAAGPLGEHLCRVGSLVRRGDGLSFPQVQGTAGDVRARDGMAAHVSVIVLAACQVACSQQWDQHQTVKAQRLDLRPRSEYGSKVIFSFFLFLFYQSMSQSPCVWAGTPSCTCRGATFPPCACRSPPPSSAGAAASHPGARSRAGRAR